MERLIDERARAIVEEEKAARAREETAAREESARRERKAALTQRVDATRKALEANRSQPTTVVGSCLRSARNVALVSLALGLFPGVGMMFHLFLFPAFGVSPAAVVCPLVCDECSAAARTFSWNFKGSWHSENGRMGYAFVCANPRYDIDRLELSQVAGNTPTNAALQPYMLSSFLSWMAEVAVSVPCLALLFGPPFGLRRRGRLLGERPKLEEALASAEAELKAFEKHVPDAADSPYR